MNWGKNLIIGMGLFMTFIVVLGIVMIVNNEKDTLIEEDYYEKGQSYDIAFEAKENAVKDHMIPVITTSPAGVNIEFPSPVSYRLTCRRLSDSKLDTVLNGLKLKDRIIQLKKGGLRSGPWMLKIEYSANNRTYLFEDEIKMP